MTEKPVNLHDDIPDFEYLARYSNQENYWDRFPAIKQQLLGWHPYGSSFEALKKRIIDGGGKYIGALKERWACGERTVHCKKFYMPHFFDICDDELYVEVGEENGRIVYLHINIRNKYI